MHAFFCFADKKLCIRILFPTCVFVQPPPPHTHTHAHTSFLSFSLSFPPIVCCVPTVSIQLQPGCHPAASYPTCAVLFFYFFIEKQQSLFLSRLFYCRSIPHPPPPHNFLPPPSGVSNCFYLLLSCVVLYSPPPPVHMTANYPKKLFNVYLLPARSSLQISFFLSFHLVFLFVCCQRLWFKQNVK